MLSLTQAKRAILSLIQAKQGYVITHSGKAGLYHHSFLTSVLHGVVGQIHSLAALLRREKTSVAREHEAFGAPEPFCRFRKTEQFLTTA
jgi:hypothetical protein